MRERQGQIVTQPVPAGNAQPPPVEVRRETATPVFGTAQPTGGLPRWIRLAADRRPTHAPVHWLLLLGADRVESAGENLRELVTPGKQPLVVRRFARQARAHPEGAATLGLLVVAVVGGYLAWSRDTRHRVRASPASSDV